MKSPEVAATTHTCVADRTDTSAVTLRPNPRRTCFEVCKMVVLCYGIIAIFMFWVIDLVSKCHRSPGITIYDVSVRNMTVSHNTTVGSLETAWRVSSDFKLTIVARSPYKPNHGCYISFHEMIVVVRYRGDLIYRIGGAMDFLLRGEEAMRIVTMPKEEQAFLRQQIGPVLEAELRSNEGKFVVDIYIDIKVNGRLGYKWKNYGCQVVATTPQKSVEGDQKVNQRCALLHQISTLKPTFKFPPSEHSISDMSIEDGECTVCMWPWKCEVNQLRW